MWSIEGVFIFRLHVVSRQQTALGTISVLNVGCLESCDDLLTVFPCEILGFHSYVAEDPSVLGCYAMSTGKKQLLVHPRTLTGHSGYTGFSVLHQSDI
jgi:hypothetical protein